MNFKNKSLRSLNTISELSPTLAGEAFYNGEVETELRRINRIDYYFKKDGDRDLCMKMIDVVRQCNNYPHLPSDSTEDCKKRGNTKYRTHYFSITSMNDKVAI